MKIATLVIIIIVALVLIALLSKVAGFLNDIKPLIDTVKDTDFNELKEEYENTPKSVSGMTSLCIPRIAADFPEFNWHEFRQKAENMLKSAFTAINDQDISKVVNASNDLRTQIGLTINANRENRITEVFKDIAIHQTEIKDYRKLGGSCIITLQSAVGYIHYKIKDGELIDGNETSLTQTRYNIDLIYVQDTDKVEGSRKMLGSTCPGCGAPISSLGKKTCEYCGCALKEININVWSINHYTEV